jgi:ribonucleoside-triphosphate reductase
MKHAKCPNCGSTNCYGLSRIVGYFSRINNWNKSKKAEFKARQKGDYEVTDGKAE